jgi:protein-tyrosine phosphatase
MNVAATPFLRSYWVVTGSLLAGCYPGDSVPAEADKKLDGLASAGILHVVNLMEEGETNRQGEPFVPYQPHFLARGIDCVRIPIQDFSTPTVDHMRVILDDIDAAIGGAAPTFVHCWGGRGRTGTVVGCYLVRHGLRHPEHALGAITELQAGCAGTLSPSPESEPQREFVRHWTPGT